jgi:hypothetical protein
MLRDLGMATTPDNAFNFLQGLETLSFRMDRHWANAQKVGEFLAKHPQVEEVFYAGLTTSKWHERAKKYGKGKGYGSVLSFNVALNARSEYEGGGTWFEGLGRSLPIERGHVCAHAGGVLHGGHPITGGVRYILVAFVILEGYQNWAMRFMKSVWDY